MARNHSAYQRLRVFAQMDESGVGQMVDSRMEEIKVVRTRPFYSSLRVCRYRGTASTDEARNFSIERQRR